MVQKLEPERIAETHSTVRLTREQKSTALQLRKVLSQARALGREPIIHSACLHGAAWVCG